jgi:DNA invertase Pin-like site-specific DNA recombinase
MLSFDRLARSVKQLVLALEEFRVLGIEFVSHQEGVDTTTPMGKAMVKMIAAMAEMEGSVVQEKEVVVGLQHAHQQISETRTGRRSVGQRRNGSQSIGIEAV